MGAIWGAINLNKEDINKVSLNSGKEIYSKCKIDKIEIYHKNNIFLGQVFQYITAESFNEKLPYHDEEKELYMVADAIIDNREELYEKLKFKKNIEEISDSEFILEAYKKWGEKSPEFLIGDFAYVIIDNKKNEVFMVRDHTGNRTLYYFYEDDILIFSTLISPILEYFHYNVEYNENWHREYLMMNSVVHQFDLERTCYEKIYKLKASNFIKIKNNEILKSCYWNIENNILMKKKMNTKNVEVEFLDLFKNVVKDKIRTSGNIGVTLSGGLDSSSVAVVANEILEKENKKLNSYTSIPLEGYENKKNDYRIGNEKEFVDEILKKYKNIRGKYIDCKGKDSLSDLEEILDILEEPYKAISNIYWYKSCFEEANKDRCKILLNGQSGNSTISWGNEEIKLVTLWEKNKKITMVLELLNFCNKNKIPLNLGIKKFNYLIKIVENKEENNKNYINPLMKIEYLTEELKKYIKENSFYNKKHNGMSEREAKKISFDRVSFEQLALYECKLGLYNGLVVRDPTRDKRIIEFCLALPIENFAYGGLDRALLRNTMKDLLPNKVRLNLRYKGLQGVDWKERLLNNNFNINFESLTDYNFLNKEEIEVLIKKYKEKKIGNKEFKLLLVIFIYIKFLERRNKYGKKTMGRTPIK